MPDHSQVQIDVFNTRDEADVIASILAIQRDEFGFDISADDQPDLREIPTFYQQGAGDFWLARVDGTVVGTIGLKDIGHSEGALRKMFVDAAHRGASLSVAARLLKVLLRTAAQRGLRRVYLGTTDRFAAAHRFYEKQGFERVAPEALPASFPRMALDTRFYAMDPASFSG